MISRKQTELITSGKHSIRLVLLTLLLSVVSAAHADSLSLKGWNLTSETPAGNNGSQIRSLRYQPTSLKKNQIFQIIVWEPVNTGTEDLKTWFLDSINLRQRRLGSFGKRVKVGKEKNGALSLANNFKNEAGQKRQVAYQSDWTDQGKAYIGQLIASNDLMMILRYSAQIDKVIEHAQNVFVSGSLPGSSNSENTTHDPTNEQITESPSPTVVPGGPLNPVSPPTGFIELRVAHEYGIVAGGLFGLKTDVLALFESGEYTSDLRTVFGSGQAASKKQNPENWGRWRSKDGKFKFNTAKQPEFKEPESGEWLPEAGTPDQKLEKCYGNITSVSDTPYGGGVTVGNASSWCFRADGRFAHSVAGFATGGSDVVSGAASDSSKIRGRYRIDGYAVKFIYDDGKELTAAFCFLSDDKRHIGINGKRYISDQ